MVGYWSWSATGTGRALEQSSTFGILLENKRSKESSWNFMIAVRGGQSFNCQKGFYLFRIANPQKLLLAGKVDGII